MQYPPGLYASAIGLPPVRIVAYTAGKCRWRPDSWDEGTILSEPEHVEAYLEANRYRPVDEAPKPAAAKLDDDETEPRETLPPRARNIGPQRPRP